MKLTLNNLWKKLYEGKDSPFITYKTRKREFSKYHPITNPYDKLSLSFKKRAVDLYHPPHGEENKSIVRTVFLEMHFGDLLYFANPDASREVPDNVKGFISNHSLKEPKILNALFSGVNRIKSNEILQVLVPAADSPEDHLGKMLFMDDFKGNVLDRIMDANSFLIFYFVDDLFTLSDVLQSFYDNCSDPSLYDKHSYMGDSFWKLIKEDLYTVKNAENHPLIVHCLAEILTWYLLYALLQKMFYHIRNYVPHRAHHPEYKSEYACVRKLSPFRENNEQDQISFYIRQAEMQINESTAEGRHYYRMGIISPDDYKAIDVILKEIANHNQVAAGRKKVPYVFPYVVSQPMSDIYWQETGRNLIDDFDVLICLLWLNSEIPDFHETTTRTMIEKYAALKKPVFILFNNREGESEQYNAKAELKYLKTKYLDSRRRTEYQYAAIYYLEVLEIWSKRELKRLRQSHLPKDLKFHKTNDSDWIARITDDILLAKEITGHTPYVCEYVLYQTFEQEHADYVWEAMIEKLSHDSAYMRPVLEFLAEHDPSHRVFKAGMPILASQKHHEYVLVLYKLKQFNRDLLYDYLNAHLIPDNDINLRNLLESLETPLNTQKKHSL